MCVRLQYEFFGDTDEPSKYFSLSLKSGLLYSKGVIDREQVCKDRDVCVIKFEVAVQSNVTEFFRLVQVRLTSC